MENENVTIKNLASFDFNAPVQVKLILDDSEEEENLAANKASEDLNTRKRKSEESVPAQGKNCRTVNNQQNQSLETKEVCNRDKLSLSDTATNFKANNDSNFAPNCSNSTQSTVLESLLLVVKGMLKVVEAYNYYTLKIKENNANQQVMESCMIKFLAMKYHYFRLLYPMLKSISFDETNEDIANNLLIYTYNISRTEHGTCSFNQIKYIYSEMMVWAKQTYALYNEPRNVRPGMNEQANQNISLQSVDNALLLKELLTDQSKNFVSDEDLISRTSYHRQGITLPTSNQNNILPINDNQTFESNCRGPDYPNQAQQLQINHTNIGQSPMILGNIMRYDTTNVIQTNNRPDFIAATIRSNNERRNNAIIENRMFSSDKFVNNQIFETVNSHQSGYCMNPQNKNISLTNAQTKMQTIQNNLFTNTHIRQNPAYNVTITPAASRKVQLNTQKKQTDYNITASPNMQTGSQPPPPPYTCNFPVNQSTQPAFNITISPQNQTRTQFASQNVSSPNPQRSPSHGYNITIVPNIQNRHLSPHSNASTQISRLPTLQSNTSPLIQNQLSFGDTITFDRENRDDDSNCLETTRCSKSTDSGFISPVHFSNTNDQTYNTSFPQEQTSSPQIAHVTSLNSGARYFDYGNCNVCKKGTKNRCCRCCRVYYCSIECQKVDWMSHQAVCF